MMDQNPRTDEVHKKYESDLSKPVNGNRPPRESDLAKMSAYDWALVEGARTNPNLWHPPL